MKLLARGCLALFASVSAGSFAGAQLRFEVVDADGGRQATEVPERDGHVEVPLPERGAALLDDRVHRVVGGVEFEVEFQLEEGEASQWRMTWLGEGPTAREQPGYALAVQFDPIYGAQWYVRCAQRRGEFLDVIEEEVRDVPEPEDLVYRLHVVLPADGGLRLSFDDGRPLAVIPRGSLLDAQLGFYRDGGVVACRLTPPRRRGQLPDELALAWRGLPEEAWRLPLAMVHAARGPALEEARRDPAELLAEQAQAWPVELPGEQPPPPTREIESVLDGDCVFDRIVVETLDRLEVPVLIARPRTAEGRSPGVLILPSTERDPISGFGGKCHSKVLKLARRLVAAGAIVAIPDPLGGGERLEFQPHDGRGDLHLELCGGSMEARLVAEAQKILNLLAARTEVDATRLAVIGLGDGAPLATGLALIDPRATRVSIELASAPHLDLSLDDAEWNAALLSRAHGEGDGPWRTADVRRWRALGKRLGVHVVDGTPRDLSPERWAGPGVKLDGVVLDTGPLDLAALRGPLGLEATEPEPGANLIELATSLIFGELEVAALWDSWFQGAAFGLSDRARPQDDPRPVVQKLAEHLDLPLEPPAPARLVVRHDGREPGAIALFETDRGTRPRALLLSDRFPAREEAATEPGDQRPLLPEGTRALTVVLGDHGVLDAMSQARRSLPARPGEVWCAIGFDGQSASRSVVELDRRARDLGQVLAGWWIHDLRCVLARLRQDADGLEIRWFGDGAFGVLATFAATLEDEDCRALVTRRCISDFRCLLEIEPVHRPAGPPSELWSKHPHPALFVPGLLSSFELEDLILHLVDREVALDWIEPRDSLGRPLSRARELARWPRLQHRRLEQSEGG